MKLFLLLVTLFFAVVGIAEAVHRFRMFWLELPEKISTFSIVYITDHDPERQIRYAGEEMNWIGASGRIVAYDHLTERQADDCRRLAERYDMILCPVDWVGKMMTFMNGR